MSYIRLGLGLIPAAILACCASSAISADSTQYVQSTMISICGNLFDLDSNAAGMTAQERAVKVQANLDNALVAASDRKPSAVRVEFMNRNAVVTLDHYLVVTADGNSASRANMSQRQLAEEWANRIRVCLADSAAVDKYLAMLTGKYAEKKVALGNMVHDEIAVAPAEMLFPIELITSISTHGARIGDKVEAVVTHDVPMQTSFASYLPAGTLVIGAVESSAPYVPNHYGGKDAFTINFYEFRTPDGREVPIDAHIYGGINAERTVSLNPLAAECCNNGHTLKDANLVSMQVVPSKGNVVGSWRGVSIEGPLAEKRSERELRGEYDGRLGAPGLEYATQRSIFSRGHANRYIPTGQPMMLQLSSTTTIAVSGRAM